MNLIGNVILTEIYNNIDTLFIILIRMAGFIVMLPILSGRNIPTLVKVCFCFISTLLIFSTGVVAPVDLGDTVFANAFLFFGEFLVGLLIAFVAYAVFSLVYLMGQLIDFQLGLSMASVYDPISQIQIPITGNLIYYGVILLFIQSGGFHSFIYTIINSFKVLPPGTANLSFDKGMIEFLVILMTGIFEAAIKFSIPIVGSILIIDVALGILVKAVPQVNVFVVGVPIKLFIGFIIFLVITPIISELYDYVFDTSFIKMQDIIEGFGG